MLCDGQLSEAATYSIELFVRQLAFSVHDRFPSIQLVKLHEQN
jgi:hypothetical protein